MVKNSLDRIDLLSKYNVDNKKIAEVIPPTYSKFNFLIEWTRINLKFYFYVFIKGLSFLLDVLIPAIAQVMLYLLVPTLDSIFSILITAIYYHIYLFVSMALSKGRTVGQLLGKTRVIHKTGFSTSWLNYYMRAFISTIYVIPVVGWVMLTISAVTPFFMRGITLTDLISQTIVVTEKKYVEISDFERQSDEKGGSNV